MQTRWEQALTRGGPEAASAKDTVAANRAWLAAQAKAKSADYNEDSDGQYADSADAGVRRRT